MRKLLLFMSCILMILCTISCNRSQDMEELADSRNISKELIYDYSMELIYAKGFSVDYYKNGCTLLSILDGSRFLIVPENEEAPEDLQKNIKVLKQPISNIYLVASAVMDMFCKIDAMDSIRLSGTKEDSWYIEDAKQAMHEGKILYAGKYSAPDYELILSEGCQLSIQSSMISHSPDVKEKLENFQIAVLVDYSSYEEHPLGRCEWVKLYGILTGREEEAREAFNQQMKVFETVKVEEQERKTVAFFYITSNGAVNVRKSEDYVAKMIELAGGSYIFNNLKGDENAASSVNMQLEEFYAKAKDVDYIIYNSTIDGGIRSLEELIKKTPLLKNFRAVKNNNVWCTTQNMYQCSMELGTMISDIHEMLTVEDTQNEQFRFLYRLE